MAESAGGVNKTSPCARVVAYTDLKNAATIMKGITSINQRIVVADLSLVVSFFHLQLATYKALLNENQGCMKTKSITAEVLYQLSSSTKITDALQQYSIKEGSSDIAFICIDPASDTENSASSTYDAVLEFTSQIQNLAIDGTEFDPQEISSPLFLTTAKAAKISKLFKITPQELEVSGLEESVSTRLAVKDSL